MAEGPGTGPSEVATSSESICCSESSCGLPLLPLAVKKASASRSADRSVSPAPFRFCENAEWSASVARAAASPRAASVPFVLLTLPAYGLTPGPKPDDPIPLIAPSLSIGPAGWQRAWLNGDYPCLQTTVVCNCARRLVTPQLGSRSKGLFCKQSNSTRERRAARHLERSLYSSAPEFSADRKNCRQFCWNFAIRWLRFECRAGVLPLA